MPLFFLFKIHVYDKSMIFKIVQRSLRKFETVNFEKHR